MMLNFIIKSVVYQKLTKNHFLLLQPFRTFCLVGNDELKAFKSVRVADVQSGTLNLRPRSPFSYGGERGILCVSMQAAKAGSL